MTGLAGRRRALALSAAALAAPAFAGRAWGQERRLKDLGARKGLIVGTAADTRELREHPGYAELIAAETAMLTATHELNWRTLQPAADRFDTRAADQLLAWPAVDWLRRRTRAAAGRAPDERRARGGEMRTLRLGANRVLQLLWRDGADGAILVALLRRGPAARFGADDRLQLACLRPHVARAMALARDLAAARRGARRRGHALDALALPLVIADEQSAVLFANRAARALPAASGLRLMRGRRLAAPPPADAAALRRALALTTDRAFRLPAAIVALGAAGRVSAQFLALDSVGPLPAGKPAARLALLVLRQRHRAPPASLGRLAERYRLTPAERRVLALVLDGCRAAAAARRLGVALATVRTQLRSIYEKTGCRSRAAVVALFGANGAGG